VSQTYRSFTRTFTPLVISVIVGKSLLLSLCAAGVAGLFLVAGFVSFAAGKFSQSKAGRKSKAAATDEASNFSVSASAGAQALSWSALAVGRSLPPILRETRLLGRLWREWREHHRWLRVLFSDHTPLYARVLSLGAHIFIPFFALVLLYNFADADDGSCEALRLLDLCTASPSLLAAGLAPAASRCLWSKGVCVPRHPTDWVTLIQVAVFASIAAAPFASAAEFVFNRVLGVPPQSSAAPVASSSVAAGQSFLLNDARATLGKLSQTLESLLRWVFGLRQRGAAVAPARLTNSVSPSTFSPVNLLHRNDERVAKDLLALLHSQGQALAEVSATRARLFFQRWTLTEDGRSFASASQAVALFPPLIRAAADRAQREQETMSQMPSRKAKGNRVVFLLVWDFLPTEASRRMLEAADFRESEAPVSGSARELGWIYQIGRAHV
jgi:hypothetical protein